MFFRNSVFISGASYAGSKSDIEEVVDFEDSRSKISFSRKFIVHTWMKINDMDFYYE